jgi:hypothetical protein
MQLLQGSYCITVGAQQLHQVLQLLVAGDGVREIPPGRDDKAAALLRVTRLQLVVVEDGVVLKERLAAEVLPVKRKGQMVATIFG